MKKNTDDFIRPLVFRQIVVATNVVYGLDNEGNVFSYDPHRDIWCGAGFDVQELRGKK